MRTVSYTFWQDDGYFLGFLTEYPDYWTQGTSKEDLLDHLRDLLTDVESGEILFVRRVEEMTV